MISTAINISYLVGALAFVIGLRGLGAPDTARRGNRLATIGMGIAILATLAYPSASGNTSLIWIAGALGLGGVIGLFAARKVAMTAMPQLVSIFNGLGGACAVLLAGLELFQGANDAMVSFTTSQLVILLLTLLIGAVAFTGSFLAYLKLDGKVWDETVTLPKHNVINLVFLALLIGFFVYLLWFVKTPTTAHVLIFAGAGLLYGFSFVAPIGGADMPVVISLLNSFTGLSAASAGLIYNNQLMLVGGILVGASGTILTVLMCRAMNRSLLNVLVGGFSQSGVSRGAGDDGQVATEINVTDLAIQLFYAKQVVLVPGYGLAVAQAQKRCKELDELLSANQVEVKYAIHPVAGRMPGHMNVLLAEVDIPYNKLLDLEESNAILGDTDVVLVVGANDVVNPSAEDDPGSSIYGMPVLQVWHATQVVVLKRSMRPGYAGIQNPLFFRSNTRMLFGDAKSSLEKIVEEVKTL